MADPIPVPSGQVVTLIDVVRDTGGTQGLTMRFRFLAPEIANGMGFEVAAEDMRALCEGYALRHLGPDAANLSQIVISLADSVVPFGESAPDTVQYFEAFSLSDDHCIWEPF